MEKVEFNKLRIEDQVEYFNERLVKGITISDICDEINLSYNTLRDRFTRNHYTFNKYSKQYECVEKLFPLDEVALEKALEKVVTKVFTPTKTSSNNELKCNVEGKVINRSFRVYDSVINDFTKFCSNSKYNQYDILSTFILEGIERYENYNN